MKITIAKCDRCGKTFYTYSGLYFCENNKQLCIALCEDCSKSFRQWLNHGPCSDCVHVPDEEYDPCEDCMAYEDDGVEACENCPDIGGLYDSYK